MVRSTICALLLLGLVACGGSGGDASPDGFSAILTVTNLNDAGPGSLRDVLDQAPNNAGIVFDPALEVGSIELLSPLEIKASVTINGLSGTFQSFTIDGGGNVRLFQTSFGSPHRLALWALVLTGGAATDGLDGGAIGYGFAEVVLRSVQVFGNESLSGIGFGGAIVTSEATFIAEDCAFTANHASTGGGALALFETTATLKRCSFYLNTANDGQGGALWVGEGSFVATNCSFIQNQALTDGGAISFTSSHSKPIDARLYACTVVGNSAASSGGLHVVEVVGDAQAHLETYHSIIAQNTGFFPDIELFGDASMTGTNTLLGVGGMGLPVDGINGNQVGDAATPLDPLLNPVVIHSVGRAARVPSAASPVVGMVPEADFVNNEGPILLDQRGELRNDGGVSDLGAIER